VLACRISENGLKRGFTAEATAWTKASSLRKSQNRRNLWAMLKRKKKLRREAEFHKLLA
jgi:hypothetical protein